MITNLWARLRKHIPFERSLIIAFGLMAAAFFAFWSIAEEILEGEGHELDQTILLALRNPDDLADPIGPQWLELSFADITALGGYSVLTLMIVGSAIYLLTFGRWRHAALLVGSVISGSVLMHFLKLGFARPRPELVDHLTHAMSFSFPSGHATVSAVAYLTGGLIMAEAHKQRRMRILIMTGAVIITMLIGISRVYLGVHWPSDVIGGWALGTGWALLWWTVMHYYFNRTPIRDSEEPI